MERTPSPDTVRSRLSNAVDRLSGALTTRSICARSPPSGSGCRRWWSPTSRVRKYRTNVRSTDNENHRSSLANDHCENWSRSHETRVESVTVYQPYERADPYNGTVEARERWS